MRLLLQDLDDPSSTPSTSTDATSTGSVPPPLNIPPSRARRQLAARLAKRKQDAEAAETTDPDAADLSAVETAHTLPEEPNELDSLAPATEKELREAGLNVESKGRFGGAFSSDDDSSDEELHAGGEDQDDDDGLLRFGRRPSTTEAKERSPLDDGDDDLAAKDSSDEDEQLEMARRANY